MNKKKILIILLAVLAIIAATVLILIKTGKLKLEKTKQTPAKVDLPPAPKYTKRDLPTDKLPKVFPPDMVQEKDMVILESYEAEVDGGKQIQYAAKYITKNSIDKNLELYQKYLADNKWKILDASKGENFAVINATKDADSVIVSHLANQAGGISIVSLIMDRKYTSVIVPISQLPQGFPREFPIEGKVLVLTNTISHTRDRLEATRAFVSKQSAQEKLDFYKKYLGTNNWAITKEETTNSSQTVIAAIKENYELALKIYPLNDSNENTQTMVFIRFYIK